MRKALLILGLLLAFVGAKADTPIGADNCTRANGAIGSNWTIVQGTWVISANTCTITSAPGNSNPVRRTAETYSVDQYSAATFPSWTATAKNGPAVRIPAATKSGYYAYCSAVTSGNCTSVVLAKVSADTVSIKQTTSSLNLAPGGTLTIRAIGTTTTVITILYNGSQINTDYSDASSPITTGNPGLMDFSTSGAVFTAWAGGNAANQAANPSISPASGTYLSQQSITMSCATGSSSIYYTTNGSTPSTGSTLYSGAFNSAASGSQTIKAICTRSGYADSAVITNTYSIAPADVQVAADNFSAYYDANLEQNNVQQLPLDSPETGGKWTAVGTLSGNPGSGTKPLFGLVALAASECSAAVSGRCAGSGVVSGKTAAVYTGRTGFSSDQYAEGRLKYGPAGPCVRCNTGGAKTGYYLLSTYGSPGTLTLGKMVAGAWTQLATDSTTTIAIGAAIRLRVLGTQFQALVNGTPVAALSVTDSSIAAGSPGIAIDGNTGQLSDWSGGNVGATDATSPYDPGYPTYTDAAMSTASWTMGWPWFQAVVHSVNGSDYWGGTFSPVQVSGSLYGIGQTGNTTGTISYRGGRFGSNQWQTYQIGVDPHDARLNNWFAPLQHRTFVPGTNGGCAAAGTVATCFDSVSYYPGVETMAKLIAQNGAAVACAQKPEYACTPFMHITKVTPASSPGDEVLTVAGSFYTPRKGDVIYEEYVSPYLRVACKGWGAEAPWQASHAYALNDYVGVSGHLYRVKVAGTSGASQPGFTSTWTAATAAGSSTTDGGVTWEYYGQPCPTMDKFTWVIEAADLDLAGASGVPALWSGQYNVGGSATPAPVFYGWSAGTADSTTACTMDTNLCTALAQPAQWVMW